MTPLAPPAEPDPIAYRESDGVLTVTLNRPHRLNAINAAMRERLAALWAQRRDDPDLRVVVLTGAGRAFSSGADVGGLVKAVRPAADLDAALSFLPGRVLDVPVIVALNGLCVGGGLQFVADADIVVAAEDAWLCANHVSMGQVSGAEVLQLAGRSSVTAVARLALAGAAYRMPAAEARAAGLVAEVVPTDRVLDRAQELAAAIAAQSPTAVRETVRLLRQRARGAIAAELEAAWAAVVRQWGHPDAMEGPIAFTERRPPRWARPATGATGPATG